MFIGTLALGVVEDDFAHAHALWCHFDVFVGFDILETFFKAHHGLSNDARLVVGATRADIGKL